MSYFIFFLGLFISFAGVEYIEMPSNSLFVGMLVLYSGAFMAIVGIVQLARKGA